MDFNPVYFVNSLLEKAIQKKASDIHFHPQKDIVSIQLRIDGILQTIESVPSGFYLEILNRIRVLSNMGTVSNNLPQDGRMEFTYQDTKKELRISLIPAFNGESLVIRILSSKENIPTLEELGLKSEMLQTTRELLARKEGLILATGPTGSGKTTTMYSLLSELFTKNPYLHIVSIEDPIEYQYPGFTQIQVNENTGLTFPEILRAVLRHDPDIILIGEIRDKETADIAVRASLTGHLVFATLHTNDTESSIHRFLDFEVNPILLSDSLLAVYNQRLVRKTCDNCQGKGCESCLGSGFSGRCASFELLQINAEKRNEIKNLSFHKR